MEHYDHKHIEQKWQKIWAKTGLYKTREKKGASKQYVLDMFPYPSGDGLHVGHPKGYIATDVYSRLKRMQGHTILHPMGWDAFGLPAENYAIANKIHPEAAVRKNIQRFKKQLEIIGFDHDWDREVNTTDPKYYKWTQWIFLRMFHSGLAYRSEEPINWCPSCQTGLANEDLEDGRCERCGSVVEKRPIPQWVLRITDYADRLLADLDKLKWPESIKESQRHWIGRSEGALLRFRLEAKPLPKRILIGTRNEAKVRMLRSLFPKDSGVTLLSLSDLEAVDDGALKEGNDFRENAKAKAAFYFKTTGIPTISTDQIPHISTWTEDGGFIMHIRELVSGGPRRASDDEVAAWLEEYVKKHGEAILTFHYAIALADKNGVTDFVSRQKPNTLIATPSQARDEGYVFDRYLKNPETGKYRIEEPKEIAFSNLKRDLHERFGAPGQVEVFTTRADTLYGATYVVLAPEHPLVANLEHRISNADEVRAYKAEAKKKTDIERTAEGKEKTGVALRGVTAEHPATGQKLPVWVADYVLADYGTGAVMAVPSHDERDYEFAKKYSLPLRQVVESPVTVSAVRNVQDIAAGAAAEVRLKTECYTGEGTLINSGPYTGQSSSEARKRIAEAHGQATVRYKLRDWVFSRQRYWGEPIPLVFCENCKKQVENLDSRIMNHESKKFSKGELLNPGWIGVPEEKLPVKLPKVGSYEPTGTGESPLAKIESFARTSCPKCGGAARRETNTMPQWAGSCWYYLRYTDPDNAKALASAKAERYWLPVDLYVGGAEHATRHLIYARFWHKFLYDQKIVTTDEPFTRLQNVGLILASDGRKMSKRFGNVVNPDDVILRFGADSLRVYEMFMGPFNQPIAWSTDSLVGARRFLERVWKLRFKVEDPRSKESKEALKRNPDNLDLSPLLHQTIKKVGDDIESFRFNTAVSSLMILVNALEKKERISRTSFETFLLLLAPFSPHICEELWSSLHPTRSIHKEAWPTYDRALAEAGAVTIIVQVNGKTRASFEAKRGSSEGEMVASANSLPEIRKWLQNKTIRKTIVVPGRLVNFVI